MVDEKKDVTFEDFEDEEIKLTGGPNNEDAAQYRSKEWDSFKKILMQRFPVSKDVYLSSVSMSFGFLKRC